MGHPGWTEVDREREGEGESGEQFIPHENAGQNDSVLERLQDVRAIALNVFVA